MVYHLTRLQVLILCSWPLSLSWCICHGLQLDLNASVDTLFMIPLPLLVYLPWSTTWLECKCWYFVHDPSPSPGVSAMVYRLTRKQVLILCSWPLFLSWCICHGLPLDKNASVDTLFMIPLPLLVYLPWSTTWLECKCWYFVHDPSPSTGVSAMVYHLTRMQVLILCSWPFSLPWCICHGLPLDYNASVDILFMTPLPLLVYLPWSTTWLECKCWYFVHDPSPSPGVSAMVYHLPIMQVLILCSWPLSLSWCICHGPPLD